VYLVQTPSKEKPGGTVCPTSAIYSIKTPMACHVMINADTFTVPWKNEPSIGGRDIKGGSPRESVLLITPSSSS
jgi:hypothetical protein